MKLFLGSLLLLTTLVLLWSLMVLILGTYILNDFSAALTTFR